MRNFKKYRQLNKEKQTDVANWLGIDRSTYSKYEAGTTEPPFSTLVRLAEHWNASVYDLMGYEDEKSPAGRLPGEVIGAAQMLMSLDETTRQRMIDLLETLHTQQQAQK